MPDYPYYVGGDYSKIYKVTDIPDRQYRKAAQFTFKDYSDCIRYPDMTLDAFQCSATFDKTGIRDASNDTDSSSWGEDVLSHTDQQGNVFYSADFGGSRTLDDNQSGCYGICRQYPPYDRARR